MRNIRKFLGSLAGEVVLALVAGSMIALVVEPQAFGRVDELLLTFVSIIIAAAVPGVALTAAAQRPRVNSPAEADELGRQLSDQVAFWFGYLTWGAFAVGMLIVGHGLDWSLTTARPEFIPGWVPTEGGRWLVFAAASLIAFTLLRARRLARAVHDLVSLGTQVHRDQAIGSQKDEIAEIAAAIEEMPTDGDRGKVLSSFAKRTTGGRKKAG